MTEKAKVGQSASAPDARPRGLFGRSARSAQPVETPPRPRTITGALIAIGVVIGCTILSALTWFIFKDQLVHLLIDANAKAKDPKSPYGVTQASADLTNIRKGQLIQAGVVGLALAFLGYALTRARSASAGRWGLVIVLVLTGQGLIPIKGLPGLANTFRGFALIAAVTVIGLMFVKSSRAYFQACRAAVTGNDPTARPVGFRGLFTNGMPAKNAPAPATAPAESGEESSRPAGSKSRAKKSSDQAAVARGAELARTRAKAASKSRRTET
jgi:hypothetical protein